MRSSGTCQQGKCNPNFTKSQNNLNANETKLLCIIRNIINACLRILIIPYLLPIVYRKVFILITTTLFKTKKSQERAI